MDREFTSIRNLVEKLYAFMNAYVFRYDKLALRFVGDYPELDDFFMTTLLKTENQPLRTESGKKLREMLVACSGEPDLKNTITRLLKVLLLGVTPVATASERRCQQFFEHVRRGLSDLTVSDLEPLEAELRVLIQELADGVIAREHKEANTESVDKTLVGIMSLLRVLIEKYPGRKAGTGSKLVPYLLAECLFKVPQGALAQEESKAGEEQNQSPKCKSWESRSSALKLLSVLSRDCLDNLHMVLHYMKEFGATASWRTNKQSDWIITHFDDEKSTTGYVGVKNLGCICYMISLFQ